MNDMQPTDGANTLKALEQFGQSPWLDFIQRSFLEDGRLQTLIDRDGLKGMTSNPSIFEKAMGHGTDYDPGFKTLAEAGDLDAQDIYEHLAVEDIQHAADLLRPVYESTKKIDGYVSLEVSPYLALRTDETIAEARRLWAWVKRDNLMVKVPGTHEGAPAIRTLIGEGMNINVTLLFSLDAYKTVAEAYIAGLEDLKAKGGDISKVRQRGQLLRLPHRCADRQEDRRPDRGRRQGCGRSEAGARQDGHRQCEDGLSALPRTDRQPALEGAGRGRGDAAAPAMGQHGDQGQGV